MQIVQSLRKRLSLYAVESQGLNFWKQGTSPFKKGRLSREQFDSGAGPTMNASECNKVEPEQLAKRIRKLAIDSHHAVKNPFVTAAKVHDLSLEIQELRKQARAASLSQIDCWLHHVQQQVEARWPAVRLTTRA
jgi:hypothetical protein